MRDPLLTQSYAYDLPDALIARHAIHPRDHARLLVYDRATGSITHTRFDALEQFLPPRSALIFNNTKVIKARLYGTKASGGKIELLLNRPLIPPHFSVYIRGRVHVGSELIFAEGLRAHVEVLCEDGSREVYFTHAGEVIGMDQLILILETIGHVPLPPYLARPEEHEDAHEYQSVFATHAGAVAAPTASLHFTDALFEQVCAHHRHAFVTLHVGAGTFKPVESAQILEHPMHSEYFQISEEARALIEEDVPLVCVGTTSTRSIEYYVRHPHTPYGEANLFLHPHNPPHRVDHLITNFHLPQSTLLMLVASFVGLEETHRIYAEAIAQRYRFFSYGDAMLIL